MNLATIVAALAVVIIVSLAVRYIIKEKNQ